MWSIIWNIDGRVKHDLLWFATESQALKYAQYYKSLFEVHDAGQHMQRRFGMDKQAAAHLAISFRLLKKGSEQAIPGQGSRL